MRYKANAYGFTLIELLVAAAIFGIVVTSMYAVSISTQETTINQGELVDVQQSLRIALDFISRDIKMAGALIPAGNTELMAGSNATALNLSTASSLYAYAQISNDLEIPAGSTADTNFDFAISVPATVDYFEAGNTVRIIRPQDRKQPYVANLIVSGVNRTAPAITLNSFANAAAVQYNAGDLVTRVGAGVPVTSTISWDINGTDLRRNRDNGGAEVMAENVTDVAFSYIFDDDSETATPAVSELGSIKAVRVRLTVEATQQLDRQIRERSISSVVYLRNSVD